MFYLYLSELSDLNVKKVLDLLGKKEVINIEDAEDAEIRISRDRALVESALDVLV